VEDQKRNIAQLVRIGAAVEKMWGSKKDLQGDREEYENEKNRDEEEKFEDGTRESQEEIEKRTLSSAFC